MLSVNGRCPGCHRTRCEDRQIALTCCITGALPMLSLIPGETNVWWTMTVLEPRIPGGQMALRVPRVSLVGGRWHDSGPNRPLDPPRPQGWLAARTACRVK